MWLGKKHNLPQRRKGEGAKMLRKNKLPKIRLEEFEPIK
jgi:hypothetical protein